MPLDDEHVLRHDDAQPDTSRVAKHKPRTVHARVPAKPASNPFRRQREALPAFDCRAKILSLIDSSQVVIVEGETGCGKSTQLPQYVLEEVRG